MSSRKRAAAAMKHMPEPKRTRQTKLQKNVQDILAALPAGLQQETLSYVDWPKFSKEQRSIKLLALMIDLDQQCAACVARSREMRCEHGDLYPWHSMFDDIFVEVAEIYRFRDRVSQRLYDLSFS